LRSRIIGKNSTLFNNIDTRFSGIKPGRKPLPWKFEAAALGDYDVNQNCHQK
jgi:hypothetical protein